MRNRVNNYNQLFTWRNDLSKYCLAHSDGYVSIMLRYAGVDIEMLSDKEIQGAWYSFEAFLSQFSTEHTIEFHHWREDDNSIIDEYRAKTKEYVRGGDFAVYMRNQYADHYAYMAMHNETAIVISIPAYKTGFMKSVKNKLVKQTQAAIELEKLVARACNLLPGAYLCEQSEYKKQIVRTYDLDWYKRNESVKTDDRFFLSDQLIRRRPEQIESENYIKIGKYFTKTFYLYLYPDAYPGWFFDLATTHLITHTSLILRMRNAAKALNDSKQSSKLADDPNQDELGQTKARDLQAFRSYVADSGAGVFLNCFIHTVYSDSLDDIEEYSQRVHSLYGNSADWRDAWYIQKPFLRYSLPGLGYLSKMFRPDESGQVISMLPTQVFKNGSQDRQQLRSGYNLNPITYSYSELGINNSVTLAASRGGKDVEKSASVIETFPLGIDWYITESDRTYQWVVEAFGGTYSVIDPSETVVNPLPPYNIALIEDESKGKLPLSPSMVGGTIKALTHLFVDKNDFAPGQSLALDIHQEAVANAAMQLLYAVPSDNLKIEAPTLVDLLAELQNSSCAESEEQLAAAKHMSARLDSFLSTTEGRVFQKQNNLILSEGITGVDIKGLQDNENMLKFILSFLAVRFAQMAYMRSSPARIVLNEMHYFARVAPEIMGPLVSGVARMGGKRAASIDLISQEPDEIDIIETGILNQMAHHTYLYRQDGHEHLANRVRMPDVVRNKWQGMPVPYNLNWRPAIRGTAGDYYNLNLSFPEEHILLSSTSAKDLEFKEAIGRIESDPMQRLALLKQAKEEGNVSFLTDIAVNH